MSLDAIRRPSDAAERQVPRETFEQNRRTWTDYVGGHVFLRNLAVGVAFGCLCLAGLAMWMAREQWMRGEYRPIVVERDGLGRPSASYELASSGPPGTLDDATVRKRVLEWVRDCHSVYVDAGALRTALQNCYAHTLKGSAAWNRMLRQHQAEPPHERAGKYWLSVKRQTALRDANRTWRAEWDEQRTGRDGGDGGTETVRATLTYTIEPPKTREDIAENPEGWKVTDYDIERFPVRQAQAR